MKQKSDSHRTLPPEKELERFLSTQRISFSNKNLLRQAFTHRSYTNESVYNLADNERLEFLGDSVLGLIANEYLYKNYPQYPEGKLSSIKSKVVSEVSLAQVSRDIGLPNLLFLGKGENATKGREKQAIQADVFESLVGAMYLDQGYQKTKKFVLKFLQKQIKKVEKANLSEDYKTILQEYCQKKYKLLPRYELSNEQGPEHDKTFFVKVYINERVLGEGSGSNKRKAEHDSARRAIQQIHSRSRTRKTND
ncbi:MAG: ribonuclease III [Spirochaetota bacterium]